MGVHQDKDESEACSRPAMCVRIGRRCGAVSVRRPAPPRSVDAIRLESGDASVTVEPSLQGTVFGGWPQPPVPLHRSLVQTLPSSMHGVVLASKQLSAVSLQLSAHSPPLEKR
jgi:hypothetical protein